MKQSNGMEHDAAEPDKIDVYESSRRMLLQSDQLCWWVFVWFLSVGGLFLSVCALCRVSAVCHFYGVILPQALAEADQILVPMGVMTIWSYGIFHTNPETKPLPLPRVSGPINRCLRTMGKVLGRSVVFTVFVCIVVWGLAGLMLYSISLLREDLLEGRSLTIMILECRSILAGWIMLHAALLALLAIFFASRVRISALRREMFH